MAGVNIAALLARREAGGASPPAAHDSFVARLEVSRNLPPHRGCVNTVEWSRDGTLVASGSDDLLVALYGAC